MISFVSLVVIASANAIWQMIEAISPNGDLYSDPSNRMVLPFPFPDNKPADRFDLHPASIDVETFTFMGRTRFRHLLNQLSDCSKESTTLSEGAPLNDDSAFSSTQVGLSAPPLSLCTGDIPEIFLYGTIGWGKSHLLAAMVCLLMRNGRKVVYLPDCRAMLQYPVRYFSSALVLTFASDPIIQQQAAALETDDQIIRFCNQFVDLIFIVDEWNALDPEMKHDSLEKSNLRSLIYRAACVNDLVMAASANNLTGREIRAGKQLNMNVQTLFGGLDKVSHI